MQYKSNRDKPNALLLKEMRQAEAALVHEENVQQQMRLRYKISNIRLELGIRSRNNEPDRDWPFTQSTKQEREILTVAFDDIQSKFKKGA